MQNGGKGNFRSGGVLNRHHHAGGRRDDPLALRCRQAALLADLQPDPVACIGYYGLNQIGIILNQFVEKDRQAAA